MRLQESGEMYLETIYVLSKQKNGVHSIDISEHLGYSKPSVSRAVGILKKGNYITVEKDGAAEHAGIQPKDIVIGLDDYKVSNVTDLTRALRNYKAGDTAAIKLIRSGKEMTLTITFDERPQDPNAALEQQPQQSGEMPSSGSYEDWYNYFYPFFGGGMP